jgi:hypothetical protein
MPNIQTIFEIHEVFSDGTTFILDRVETKQQAKDLLEHIYNTRIKNSPSEYVIFPTSVIIDRIPA